MIQIDGGAGEGGGQILRTALGLSLITSQAFRMQNIRAGRANPGLLRQHLTAVEAALKVGDGVADGVGLGSKEVVFKPGKVTGGDYKFAVGTAGSATLVLQTILPPLLLAGKPSVLTLEGGTHNPHAPPFEFLARVFLPLIGRMGPKVTATLERAGFYPAGGGRFTVGISPLVKLAPLDLLERGEDKSRRARALVANLPRHVGDRELKVVTEKLGWSRENLSVEEIESNGPGNALLLEIESEHCTEIISGFGEKGTLAETIAERAVEEARRYLASRAPVGEHLADQLLIPLALAGSGSFRATTISQHTRTNIETISKFLPVRFSVEKEGDGSWLVSL